MSEIPGSAMSSATRPTGLEKLNGPIDHDLPEWASRPRWSVFEDNSPPRPFSPERSRGVAMKRSYEQQRDDVPERECVRFAQLERGHLAAMGERKGTKLWPFAIARGKLAAPPSSEQQERLCGAKWELRGPIAELFGWFITGQIIPFWVDRERKTSRGVIAKQRDLGTLLASKVASGRGERSVREYVHKLRLWGLIAVRPTVRFWGAVSSQREHVYRVTKLAIDTFDLPLDRELAPEPEPVRPRRTRCRGIARASGDAHAHARQTGKELPSTPDNTCVIQPQVLQDLRSITLDSRSAFIDGPISLPPPVAPLPVDDRSPGAPAVRSAESAQPGIPGESCSADSRPVRPESREASSLVRDVIPSVKRGEVDRDRRVVDVENGVYRRGVVEYDRAKQANIERETDDERRAMLRRQLERRKREIADDRAAELEKHRADVEQIRETERAARARLDDVPPPMDADAPAADAGDLAADRDTELARYRAQLERDREEFANTPRPRPRGDVDDIAELKAEIEKATKSFEQMRAKRLSRTAGRKGRFGGGES